MNITTHTSSEASVEAVQLAQKTLSTSMADSLLCAAHKFYQRITASVATQCTVPVAGPLLPACKYLPHASSVSLAAVADRAFIDALLNEIGLGSTGCHIRTMLGTHQVLCDLDQAWIRRQYAPHLYPPKHAPHGWHQDGALGFDFFTQHKTPLEADALLPTVTCWITLTDCGMDSPGLEFVLQPVKDLLRPQELLNNAVKEHFSADSFYRPQMKAGDAVVFQSATLHRTHVNKEMQSNRTSVELRFVGMDNIPPRLSEDFFVPLPQAIT
ncbi:MAG: phytanoyl-CoA dioxygenase family protein [Paraglaciecola sp.]|nr:phytanoyl-CoA dioxygenase family protein [Paraglaciecola sp.]